MKWFSRCKADMRGNGDVSNEEEKICDFKSEHYTEDTDKGDSKQNNAAEASSGDQNNDQTPAATLKQKYFALAVYFGALLAQCASHTSIQLLGGAIPPFELNMWRYLAQVVLVLPVNLLRRTCDFHVPKSRWLLASAMILVSSIRNVTIFTASIYLPLGVAFSMQMSMSLALTAIISIFIKQDRQVALVISAFIAVVGLQLMTQPEFMFPKCLFPPPPVVNYTSECSIQTEANVDTSRTWIGYLLIATASFAQVAGLYGARILMQDVSVMSFAFWLGFINSILSALLMGVAERPVLPSSPFCLLLLAMHCFGTSPQTILLPWALKYINPTVSMLAKSSIVVVPLILQYTLLKEINPGKQNWLEIVGGVTVMVACSIGPVVHIVTQYVKLKTQPQDYITLDGQSME